MGNEDSSAASRWRQRLSRFPRAPYCLLALIGIAVWWRVLLNDFAYDDFRVLVNNVAVTKSFAPIQWLLDPATHSSMELAVTFRPLRTAMLGVMHGAFGLRPIAYHALGLALHLVASLLMLAFLRQLLGARWGFVAAALWMVHPIQTEVVANVKAIDDLMACCFQTASLALVVRIENAGPRSRRAILAALPALAFLGCLSKESAVAQPLLMLCVIFARSGEISWKRCLPLLVPTATACVLFIALRAVALQGTTGTGTGARLALPSLGLVPMYFMRLAWPRTLIADYSHLPVLQPTDPLLLASLGAQVAVLAICAWHRRSPVAAGILFFYAALLPSLNLAGGIVLHADRFVHVASAGTAMALAAALMRFRRGQTGTGRLLGALLIGVVAGLGVRSWIRIADWHDDVALFRSATAAAPSNRIVREFLASALLKAGAAEEARQLIGERQVAEVPATAEEARAARSSAMLLLKEGRWQEAIPVLQLVIESSYGSSSDRINMATAQLNAGALADAGSTISVLLADRPDDAQVLRLAGRQALDTGKWQEADGYLRRATLSDPASELGWYFSVFAAWKAGGESPALERLRESAAAGISVEKLATADAPRWESAGSTLRQALGLEVP